MARLVILQFIAGCVGGIIAAKKDRSMLLWFLLCFIFPLLTLVIVFMPSLRVRPPEKRCPDCSRPLGPNETVCRHGNRERLIELVPCSTCGSYIPEHQDCPVCNKKK